MDANRVTYEVKRTHVERFLNSDLSVSAYCNNYKLSPSTLYGWVDALSKREPELFGGEQNIVSKGAPFWLVRTRNNIRESRALSLCSNNTATEALTSAGESDNFISLSALLTAGDNKKIPPTSAVTITINSIQVDVPLGCSAKDIKGILEAVWAL